MTNSNNKEKSLNDFYNKKHNTLINEDDFFFSYLIENNKIDLFIDNSGYIELFSFNIFDIINISYNKEDFQIEISIKNNSMDFIFNTDKDSYGKLIILNLFKAISDFKSKKTNIQNL